MKIRKLIYNVLVWPLISLVLFFASGLLIDVSWSQLLKTLPFLVVLTIFYCYGIYSFMDSLTKNQDLILSETRDEINSLVANTNLSLVAYLESFHLLKGFIDGRPIPSSRTGHEHLGNPKKTARIMGAIPKNATKKRANIFLENMKMGVHYRMIYLDEGSVRSGIKAYCKQFITQIDNNIDFKKIKIEEQFRIILVPPETVQMSFDIFDEDDEDIGRMLIHFPRFGALQGDEFNHAWRIDSTEVIRHYGNIFDVIWSKYKSDTKVDIIDTAEHDLLVMNKKKGNVIEI